MRPLLITVAVLLLVSCSEPMNQLQQIKERGELIVATRNSPTAYYEGAAGPAGFEYDLVSMFADYLGVKLRPVIVSGMADIFNLVNANEVDIAAAGLSITDERIQQVRFGPVYQYITQQLIYSSPGKRPASLMDIHDYTMEVMAHSSHAENLRFLRASYPQLTWHENRNLESEDLLTLVNDKLIDYTVADSNEVALKQRFFPELRVAFDITDPQPLAWAFSYAFDFSLHNAAYDFFAEIRKNGKLDSLIERYYGHTEHVNYPRWRLFMSHVDDRLGSYQAMFEQAGQETGIDWRLLAAMGYQESLWDPNARSATGVRGLMMLTRNTAQELGVDSRTDAQGSVDGGSRYLNQLLQMLPEEIQEPDRTWFALASYNVGIGHVEDARAITRMRGLNPNLWTYVKDSLPLLRDKQWYMQVPYGYARGDEAVSYVQSIRAYYDLLVWMSDRKILMGKIEPRPPTNVTTADAAAELASGHLPTL